MFSIRLDVNREIFVVLRLGESVVFFEPVNLRLTDGGNLALVRIQRAQSFSRRSLATNRAECFNQFFRLRLLRYSCKLVIVNADTIQKFLPMFYIFQRCVLFFVLV